jgi:hypothetical protein
MSRAAVAASAEDRAASRNGSGDDALFLHRAFDNSGPFDNLR